MTTKILTARPMPGRVFRVVEAMTMLARLLRNLPTALAHRDQLRMLAGSDDHLLADIGVTRHNIDIALSVPFWRDPSAEIVHHLGESTADGRCRHMSQTRRGAGQAAVSSPELVLAACNHRLPVAPV